MVTTTKMMFTNYNNGVGQDHQEGKNCEGEMFSPPLEKILPMFKNPQGKGVVCKGFNYLKDDRKGSVSRLQGGNGVNPPRKSEGEVGGATHSTIPITESDP